MADLTAFSCSKFDTTAWINDSFRERPEEEALESYLASLAMKLHIISQDYTDQLETGMVEAMTTMPRVLSDVARIEEVLKNIEEEMQSLAAQLRTFDQRNVAGVEDLSRLDTLKNNMEQCKATLEEHARWSQVVREAKNFLESGGRLADSADRIETMYRSLEILQNLPGHEERKVTCETLSGALLAALRPRVRRDIVNLDLSPLHEYLYVYERLGKKTELEEEYVQARPELLKPVWDQYATMPPAQFGSWLSGFLHRVLELLGEEAGHAGSLFGADRAPAVICSLLQHTVAPLAVPMAERLLTLCKDSPLPGIEIYGMTEEFARAMACFLDGCSNQSILSAVTALFAGFNKFLELYGICEGNFLRVQLLETLDLVSFRNHMASLGLAGDQEDGDLSGLMEFSDPMEAYEAFGVQLVKAADAIFAPTQAAVLRSATLHGGLKVKQVCKALALTLSSHTKLLTGKVDELRIACGFPSDLSAETGRGKGVPSTPSTPAPATAVEDSHTAAQHAELTAEGWASRLDSHDLRGRILVPSALRALQASGRISRKLAELEEYTCDILATLSTSLFRDVALDKMMSAIKALPAAELKTSSLSNVGAAYACVVLQSNPSAASELKSFFASSASHHASQTVFSSVSTPVARLKASAGALLFDLCTAAPDKMVSDLRTDEVWCCGASVYNQSSSVERDREGEESHLTLCDNLLPLPAFTQVGEHLLSLVQELEGFASSDALPDLWRMTGEAQTLSLLSFLSCRGWRQLTAALDLKEEEGVERLCARVTCAPTIVSAEKAMFGAQLSKFIEEPVTPPSSSSAAADGSGDNERPADLLEDDEDAAALGFVNEWLGAIADSAVGLIVAQLVQIPVLSPQGRAQLLVDIEYISNVVQAMGLRLHPLLSHMHQILLKDPLTLLSAVDSMPVRSPVSIALQRFDSKVAKALCVGHGFVSPDHSRVATPVPTTTPPSSHA